MGNAFVRGGLRRGEWSGETPDSPWHGELFMRGACLGVLVFPWIQRRPAARKPAGGGSMTESGLLEIHEEILEAVWKTAEREASTLAAVRRQCVVAFPEEELDFLEGEGLVVRSGERVLLSDAGSAIAERIVRRHRIAEVLLSSVLKVKNAEMERIACEVEHSLQPEMEAAICTLLGHPAFSPGGKPIPRGACCREKKNGFGETVVSLEALEPGAGGRVTCIRPDAPVNLDQLIALGITPGAMVTLIQKTPVCCIRCDNTELALDRKIAGSIYIWKNGEN